MNSALGRAQGLVALPPTQIGPFARQLRIRRTSCLELCAEPVFPQPRTLASDQFLAAVALRDAARVHILAQCGEPDAGPQQPDQANGLTNCAAYSTI